MSERTKENQKFVYLLVCIICAFCLWVYVSYVENPDMTRWIKNVPVTIVGESRLNENGFAVKSVSTTKIDVKVRTKRNMFRDLSSSTIKATADVSSLDKTGENVLTASVSFPSSSGITIADTGKMDIKIIIDEFTEKTVPVAPDIAKELPEGYYIKSVSIDGGEMSLTASGCKSDIERIHHISTNSADFSNVVDNTVIPMNFTAVDENSKPVSNVKLSLNSADVSFEIFKETAIPLTLEVTGDDPELIYELSSTAVFVTGPAALVDELTTIRVGSVNEFHYKDGSSVSFTIPLPESITLVEEELNKVDVTFTKIAQ